MKKKWFLLILLFSLFIFNLNLVYAEEAKKLEIALGASKLIRIDNLRRVAVGNPKIADVITISNQELLVNGLRRGKTTIHLWAEDGLVLYKVKITEEESDSLTKIRKLIQYGRVKVAKIDKTILLRGEVDNKNQRQRVEEIADIFGEEVINQIEVENALQVLLEAQVFEIDRTTEEQLGIDWYGVNTYDDRQLKSGRIIFDEDLPEGTKFGIGSLARITKLQTKLQALRDNGAAKLLAQPKLITKSGQQAKFMVGGEIPIVTTDTEGKQTVNWREYGVEFNIKPQVTSNGKLDTYINPQVSRLDWANAVEYGNGQLPAIKSSEVATKVIIPDGSTVAIGGLIQEYQSENIEQIPLLNRLPILGALFKSRDYQTHKSELMILVKPKIINLDEKSKDLMGLDNLFEQKEKMVE